MILDTLQTIINHSLLKNQLSCMEINMYTYNNLYIYAIGYTESSYGMDQKIIEQKKYNRLKILNCRNCRVTSVNHLCDTLEILHCELDCGIGQKG